MKFKRFLDKDQNLFESIFEKYYANGFFGNIEKKVIKEQQSSWCIKLCDMIQRSDLDCLSECLESRDSKPSREWISVIISNDILADSRSVISEKLQVVFSEGEKLDKAKEIATNLAGDALVIGSLLKKALGPLNISLPSISNAIKAWNNIWSLGVDNFKYIDPDQDPESIRLKITKKIEREVKEDPEMARKTPEEIKKLIDNRVKSTLTRYRNAADPERAIKGRLSFGSKKRSTPEGEIFQLVVGYDYGDFLGFILNIGKQKGKDLEIVISEIKDRDKLESALSKMDRSTVNYFDKISKLKDGNKIVFINRKNEKDNAVLVIDCNAKDKKCIVRTEDGELFNSEKL